MPFTPEQRFTLLVLARRALEAAVCGREIPPVAIADPTLNQHQAAFVTIKCREQLRGCIGRFAPDQPLATLVMQLAASAATQDPRFELDRLQPNDLCHCHIEVSVLSPLERIHPPTDFQIGVHGISVRAGDKTGCFLPQVGPESGWTAEEMLEQCCTHKAGLPPQAWRTGEVEVSRFTAEIIEEPHL